MIQQGVLLQATDATVSGEDFGFNICCSSTYAAETMANLPRKLKFRNLARKNGLQVVEDPREAAAIMMLEVAQARGALTERQEAVIRAEMIQHFEFSEADAEGLIKQAGWLARDAGAPHAVMCGVRQRTTR